MLLSLGEERDPAHPTTRLVLATTRMNAEDITQSEISQTQKDKLCEIPCPWCENSQIHRQKGERTVGKEGWRRGDGELVLVRAEFQLGMLWVWREAAVTVAQGCEGTWCR